MSLSVIRVSFSRQANDGDYGSETARCELEYAVGPEDDEMVLREMPALLLIDAREFVHAELTRSPNVKVRRAVEAPKVAAGTDGPTGDDVEDLPF
jgi:hypothetical protein